MEKPVHLPSAGMIRFRFDEVREARISARCRAPEVGSDIEVGGGRKRGVPGSVRAPPTAGLRQDRQRLKPKPM